MPSSLLLRTLRISGHGVETCMSVRPSFAAVYSIPVADMKQSVSECNVVLHNFSMEQLHLEIPEMSPTNGRSVKK